MACAAVAVLFVFWTHRIQTQTRIVRDVRLLGGNVLNISMDTHTVIANQPSWVPTFAQSLVTSRVNFVLLEGPHIGDDEVAMAAELPGIQGLEINQSVITDDTLLKLHDCKTLVELHLYDVTTISEATLAEFRDACPGCQIYR